MQIKWKSSILLEGLLEENLSRKIPCFRQASGNELRGGFEYFLKILGGSEEKVILRSKGGGTFVSTTWRIAIVSRGNSILSACHPTRYEPNNKLILKSWLRQSKLIYQHWSGRHLIKEDLKKYFQFILPQCEEDFQFLLYIFIKKAIFPLRMSLSRIIFHQSESLLLLILPSSDLYFEIS